MAEVLQGDLGWVSLGGLLQLVDGGAATGVIHLGSRGRIEVYQGQPVYAKLDQQKGVGALLDAFLLQSGPFRITDDEVAPGGPLMPIMAAVLEGYRIADEWDRLGAMRLKWSEPPSSALASLNFDGSDIAAAVFQQHPGGVSAAIDPVLKAWERGQLVDAGPADFEAFERFKLAHKTLKATRAVPPPTQTQIARAAAPKPAPPPKPKEDFDTLLNRARQAVKSRDLEAAETLLQDCLTLRPSDKVVTQNLRRVRALRSAQV